MQKMISLLANTRLMVEQGRLKIKAEGVVGVTAVVIIIFLAVTHFI